MTLPGGLSCSIACEDGFWLLWGITCAWRVLAEPGILEEGYWRWQGVCGACVLSTIGDEMHGGSSLLR